MAMILSQVGELVEPDNSAAIQIEIKSEDLEIDCPVVTELEGVIIQFLDNTIRSYQIPDIFLKTPVTEN